MTLHPMTVVGEWIVEGYRWGSNSAPWLETLVIMLAIAVMALACRLIFRQLHRRDRKPKQVADQWQTLAVMGELCPRGWQARITLYGDGAPLPLDAPPARAPLVELEWERFDGRPPQAIATRRTWARSIGGALQMMVDDRSVDVTLEQAAKDGRSLWELD